MDAANDIYLEITRHRSAIMATVVAMVRDFNDAEDVFQNAVLEIMRHGDRFDPTREFLPWARGIARNIARRHFASKKTGPQLVAMDDIEFLADVVDEDETDVWEEERRRLRGCLARLKDDNRTLLMLRYGNNLKGPALAKASGRNEKSLRTTLFRLKNFLQKCLKTIQPETEWTGPETA